MALKIIAIGDPHFMNNNKQETDIMHESIIEKIDNYEPDIVVILGDVFDRHSEVNIFALERGSNFIFDIMKRCPTYILVGNHDMLNNDQFFPKEHSLYPFKKYDNITVVDKTKKVTIKDKILTFVPYVPPGRFFEALDHVEGWKKSDIIFAHQEFKGSMVTSNKPSLTGDPWPEEYPQVISGHEHIRHMLRNNIYYPGSPQQVKINDDEERYIAKIEIDESIKIRKVRIDSLIKRKITLKVKDVKKYKPEEGVKLRIDIVGTQDEHSKLASKSDIITKWRSMGIKVTTDIKVERKKNTSEKEIEKTYREIVFEEIGDDDDVKLLYEGIIRNA